MAVAAEAISRHRRIRWIKSQQTQVMTVPKLHLLREPLLAFKHVECADQRIEVLAGAVVRIR
jgi:hypothetical protein